MPAPVMDEMTICCQRYIPLMPFGIPTHASRQDLVVPRQGGGACRQGGYTGHILHRQETEADPLVDVGTGDEYCGGQGDHPGAPCEAEELNGDQRADGDAEDEYSPGGQCCLACSEGIGPALEDVLDCLWAVGDG